FALAPILFGLPPLIGKVLWPDISVVPFLANISKPDENVFIAVVFKYMPAGLVGLFIAAMMSASMSAMDSAWNAVSAIVSIDLYKTFLRPNAGDRETLVVGRITIVALAILAIAMALMIVRSEYGVFTVSNIALGLIGVPMAIPLFLGIVNRRVSRWSAVSSVLVGTIVAALARFTLKYTLGPQYIVTALVTLLYFWSSWSLGQLYLRSRIAATAVNTGLALGLFLFFLSANSNSELSFGSFAAFGRDEMFTAFGSPLFLTILATFAILMLSQIFAGLYARDLSDEQHEVDEFFRLLSRPIDVEKEVGDDTAEATWVLRLVGRIALGLSLVSLFVLLFPDGRSNIVINLAVFGLLATIGGAMLFLGTKRKIMPPKQSLRLSKKVEG
ncbi:hypothetical protein MJD09_17865, partial [bacterium]|nr:hypothetical protein [bacterium]